MPGDDRLSVLLNQPTKRVTGIDFIRVLNPMVQNVLQVYFLVDPEDLGAGTEPVKTFSEVPITTSQITITSLSGGERLADVLVRSVDNDTGEGGRHIVEITTNEPGDFSLYRLFIDDARIDRFFNNVDFSFKQGCPSVLDCKPSELECPPETAVDFPIDYLARDFVSLRSALLDYASQRYPQWTEQIEADAGVMLAEVMAALGDELSYIQDRYAREAYLETATQRRSLRYHTRLVDYNIHDGLSAGTYLDLTVKSGVELISAGTRVWAPVDGDRPIPFELGRGLAHNATGLPQPFWVQRPWNEIMVHLPDPNAPCLPVGSTELFVRGHVPTVPQVPAGEDPATFWKGKWLLLKTDPEDLAIPARRHLVRVAAVEYTTDPLWLDDSNNPIEITRIKWEAAQALPFEMCLADMAVRGNMVFATAGETVQEVFTLGTNTNIPTSLAAQVDRAIERQGLLNEITCERSITFRYSLKKTAARGLGWLGPLRQAVPEIELQEVDATTLQPLGSSQLWTWERTLLDARGAQDKFTLEDGTWRRVIGFERFGEVIEHVDYASASGFTIRFGDGEFGRIPPDETVFQVRYRTGPGTLANLPADTVVLLTNPIDDSQHDLLGVLDAVTNPFAVTDGIDPEPLDVIKQLAPEAFRALTFRAVRPEDYREIAERLPWVQRAGARLRWTGSWLRMFVTADPLGAFSLSRERRTELANLMDCVRQAGREVVVRNPQFVNLDLEIAICVEPFAYAGQVQARVLEALLGREGVRPLQGFFHPDHFTFGTPLQRAALEATIQSVPGVRGVERMCIRARGLTDWLELEDLVFTVGDNQVIRLQNDPRFPERGSLRIVTVDDSLVCIEENEA